MEDNSLDLKAFYELQYINWIIFRINMDLKATSEFYGLVGYSMPWKSELHELEGSF